MRQLNAKITYSLIVLLCVANLYAQKPMVGIVVWDGHAKEGQNVGTFRLYQIGDVTPDLKVKIDFTGTAREGIDYRAHKLIHRIDRYKDLHIRPISDDLVEGAEEVTIRLVESDDYEIAPQYSHASMLILDDAFPDVEFDMPASINEEAHEQAVLIATNRGYDTDCTAASAVALLPSFR